jgi:hypothetical protein
MMINRRAEKTFVVFFILPPLMWLLCDLDNFAFAGTLGSSMVRTRFQAMAGKAVKSPSLDFHGGGFA